jgi:hypothetical protein
VGYKLRRMIRDGAPSEWSPLMRLVAAEIADEARDPGREKDPLPSAEDWPKPSPWAALPIEGEFRRGEWTDGLVERCGMSARAISRTLADLAEEGYDMRLPITGRDGRPVRDKRGRLVYAAKGHALRFRVPHLPPRPKPQCSPDSVTFDSLGEERESSPEVASFHVTAEASGDPHSSPEVASIEAQRSPLLVPKVAESGDPIPSASPKVKTGPQDQGPGALRLPQIANSKTASSRFFDPPVAGQAPHFPGGDSESTCAGTGTRARARRTDTPAA